ncbi:hypothetical protein LCGC14_2331030 [marine sediment metagenome]|uniref:Uncharacterized protein n=1 Tax=marine sediment metagenome TaxID=412755 RepID=A0A0F9CFK3_9ZZZZ
MNKNGYFFDNITEMVIWKKFKKYNRIKYFFLFFIGFFSGIILLTIINIIG